MDFGAVELEGGIEFDPQTGQAHVVLRGDLGLSREDVLERLRSILPTTGHPVEPMDVMPDNVPLKGTTSLEVSGAFIENCDYYNQRLYETLQEHTRIDAELDDESEQYDQRSRDITSRQLDLEDAFFEVAYKMMMFPEKSLRG